MGTVLATGKEVCSLEQTAKLIFENPVQGLAFLCRVFLLRRLLLSGRSILASGSNGYFTACAASGGKAPANPASFLPWNMTEDRLAELRDSISSESSPDTSGRNSLSFPRLDELPVDFR